MENCSSYVINTTGKNVTWQIAALDSRNNPVGVRRRVCISPQLVTSGGSCLNPTYTGTSTVSATRRWSATGECREALTDDQIAALQ